MKRYYLKYNMDADCIGLVEGKRGDLVFFKDVNPSYGESVISHLSTKEINRLQELNNDLARKNEMLVSVIRDINRRTTGI